MVGMHLTKTRGGISTLTSGILRSDLSTQFEISYIASQAEDLGKAGKALLAIGSVFRFIAACFLKRPDLVYVHVGSNASLYRESFFILLAKLFRIRVLSHFHAGDIDDYYPFQPRLGRRFISAAIGWSNAVIAVSLASKRQLVRLAPRVRISLIPNVIDTSLFDTAVTQRRFRRGGPVRLLFVGATGKLKGESDLIMALKLLEGSGLDVRASFIGYGAEKLSKACSDLGIRDLIEHLGPVPVDDRIEHFMRADIFVLPTYAEAMPISVIEAMAAGLPVISTPVGGIPELVDDGHEGYLVTPGDAGQLADKISILVKDGKMRTDMGHRARRKARTKVDFDGYIDSLRDLMVQVSGKNQ
jgi:glycosyltransferase involved in cell wall biosynthesis